HLPSTPVDGRRGRRTRVKRKRVGSGTSRCEGPSAPSGPCLVAVRDRSETPAARRLDPDEISRGEVARDLRGNLLAVQEIAPEGSRLAAPCALRCPCAALADERQAARIEHVQLPNDPLAAAVTPTPPGAEPQLVPLDPERVAELERLGGRRERVRHRDVNPRRAVRVGACALASSYRLVVGEAVVAESEVVHGPLPLRGHLDRTAECGED